MSDQAAPGWYPVDERTERWWDGTQWSEHQRPLGQGDPQAQAGGQAYPYAGDQLTGGGQGGPFDAAVPGQAPAAPGYGTTPGAYGAPGQPLPSAYGQAPVYGQAPAKRSTGRTVGAVVLGVLAALFTLVALGNIANNTSSGSRGIGYVIGSLLIPVAMWVGFYFLVRRPKR